MSNSIQGQTVQGRPCQDEGRAWQEARGQGRGFRSCRVLRSVIEKMSDSCFGQEQVYIPSVKKPFLLTVADFAFATLRYKISEVKRKEASLRNEIEGIR